MYFTTRLGLVFEETSDPRRILSSGLDVLMSVSVISFYSACSYNASVSKGRRMTSFRERATHSVNHIHTAFVKFT